MMSTRSSSVKAMAAAVSALCLMGALTACGSKATDASAGATAAGDDYGIKLAQCLRDKGFNVRDPSPNRDDDVPSDVDPQAFSSAVKTCTSEIGQPAGGSGKAGDEVSDAQVREENLKAAQCLRKNGYNVPDPKPNEGLRFEDVPSEAVSKCLGEASQGK